MIGTNYIARICALIGDPARANILYSLKADKVMTAGELANVAGVANSTTSEHLAKLAEAGLVQVTKQGRCRHYSLSNDTIADILISFEGLAVLQTEQTFQPKWDEVHIHARRCMDHIAGRLGCGIAANLIERGLVVLQTNGPDLTDAGESWAQGVGLNPVRLLSGPRQTVSLCNDWIENTPHLGGTLGAELMRSFLGRDWIRRDNVKGKTLITPKGSEGFRKEFQLNLRPTLA